MKLLKLTQIENGKTFYVNIDDFASINPTFKLKPEVILGEDHNIYFTQITLKNGVKLNAKESPDAIAYNCGEEVRVIGNNKPGSSGPKADRTAGYGTEPWSPDANLERSSNVPKVPHKPAVADPMFSTTDKGNINS